MAALYKNHTSAHNASHTHLLKSGLDRPASVIPASASDMVVFLGPGKFYGSSLPRPRFYADVRLNSERVDPPMPVMDPLLKWADEAHWSMGGLSFKRLRLQGRIEGNVEKLRAQRERTYAESQTLNEESAKRSISSALEENQEGCTIDESPSPPPAPVAVKRRRVVGLSDEETKRGVVRNLRDDFGRVASESGMTVDEACGSSGIKRNGATNNRRKLVKGGGKVGAMASAAAVGTRKSPRLSRSRSK